MSSVFPYFVRNSLRFFLFFVYNFFQFFSSPFFSWVLNLHILNYDETDYVLAENELEKCYENDDEEGFLKCFYELNRIAKEMPVYEQKLVGVVILESSVNIKSKFPQIDEKMVMDYNKPIMKKAMKKYINLRDDLLQIKKVSVYLLKEMDKEMQTVTASQKYEKAI